VAPTCASARVDFFYKPVGKLGKRVHDREVAPDVIALLDRNHRYVYVNDAVEVALGYAPSLVIGRHTDELMPEAARWREAIDAVFASREPRELQWAVDTPNGPRCFVALISAVGRDLVVSVSRDVDGAGHDRVNEITHEIASSFASELDHDRLVERIIEELRAAIGAETGSFYSGVVSVEAPRAASNLEVPILSLSGERLGLLAFRHREPDRFTVDHQHLAASVANQAAIALENARLYRSVRDHKDALERAVDRAQLADRRKDEFLAMLGHELRNPLAPIMTALELMEMKELNTLRKERDVIRRQVTHLSRLIDDLLDVARITRGTIQLQMQTIDLSAVIAESIEMASPLLEMPHEEALVDADPTRLAQVFQNLLTNASKYSGRRSRIEVRVVATDEHIHISVRDQGIGIKQELLPRLFDMFAQGERALDRAQGGLGIGLTIARSLCELHGGTITAASDGPHHGATFTVALPRSHATGPTKPLRALGTPRGARVLVVDDNIDAAVMLRETLSELGHELQIAHDGPSALELAASFQPDIAVLDIGLPGMSGYELARKLREQRGSDQLRLIALTGYGQEADRARAREFGFDHHLIKPIELDALLALLAR